MFTNDWALEIRRDVLELRKPLIPVFERFDVYGSNSAIPEPT
jgi:hypothetical protein